MEIRKQKLSLRKQSKNRLKSNLGDRMMTTRLSDIKHDKHTLDAKGQVLGRLATKTAKLLTGKNKSYFTRHLDCGDFVTIINAKEVQTTGKKDQTKIYTSYSGYPAGLKKISLQNLRQTKPERVIYHAVSGMLPDNKLKKFWLNRLTINP